MKSYYVYIISSFRKTIYVGITNNLVRRIYEHKQGLVEGFTKKYKVKNLVYFEETADVKNAIEREKEIKGWRRDKKVRLIKSVNPGWSDLYENICEK